MQYEFAPLEGITGYIYRNAHHACFPSMDRYYTPFITPKKGKSFTTREWNDIAAEHNQNIAVVPQILTNQAEGFCKVAGMLKEQGYEEVNLNLGCPSATVTAFKFIRVFHANSRFDRNFQRAVCKNFLQKRIQRVWISQKSGAFFLRRHGGRRTAKI